MGYSWSSGPIGGEVLKTLLLNCIHKVKGVGLRVMVIIADQGSNNRSLFGTQLGVTREKKPCGIWRAEFCSLWSRALETILRNVVSVWMGSMFSGTTFNISLDLTAFNLHGPELTAKHNHAMETAQFLERLLTVILPVPILTWDMHFLRYLGAPGSSKTAWVGFLQ